MNTPKYMSGAALEAAEQVHPDDVIASLRGYVLEGGDISPLVYDRAISRCEPPMDKDGLEQVVGLCAKGIASRHMPKSPIDHERAGRQEPTINATQSHFAALLGASSIRLDELNR